MTPLQHPKPTRRPEGVVNVASVDQRSPFRYPGGKTWLVPWFKHWFEGLEVRPKRLIEPFCGGGIISMTALAEYPKLRVIMGEADPDVAAVWRTLAGGGGPELAALIREYELTRERASEDLARGPQSDLHHAFQTILRNRVQRGGIMSPGASLMRSGENGKGIASRWYPETLARRILAIHEMRDRIEFRGGDAMKWMGAKLKAGSSAWFIDPPYTAGGKRAGGRLYAYSELDHRRLFELAARAAGPVMLTYDDAPEVRSLAGEFGFTIEEAPMKSTHHARMVELLILNR